METLIDIPLVLRKAMSWKSTIPEIPVVYFTSNYINSGLVKGLSFSNGFVHSDNLELIWTWTPTLTGDLTRRVAAIGST
jgi:hypothetical protein